MASPIYLAVDVMGGDESPHSFVSASVSFLKQFPHVHITLFGDKATLENALHLLDTRSIDSRLAVAHAEQIVAPEEKPAAALRTKKGSSMWLALQSVADGRSQAVLSAGNTGALMVMARHIIGSLEGIERPAICKRMPVSGAVCFVLDLGANIVADAKQLHEFALMGAALAEVEGVTPAQVGLLNVGQEHQKGTDVLQEADKRLRNDTRFSYTGFVEGNAIFDGVAHVIVCDGFAGNVALKASEGLARYLMRDLQRYFTVSWLRKLSGGVIRLMASGWLKRLDPASYNGALLVGLKGVVVKSHGGADGKSFQAALKVASDQAQRRPDLLLARWLSDTV